MQLANEALDRIKNQDYAVKYRVKSLCENIILVDFACDKLNLEMKWNSQAKVNDNWPILEPNMELVTHHLLCLNWYSSVINWSKKNNFQMKESIDNLLLIRIYIYIEIKMYV